jgi:hypothetical protein
MNQGHGGRNLVDVLAARPARARKDFFELFRAHSQAAHTFGGSWIRAEHGGILAQGVQSSTFRVQRRTFTAPRQFPVDGYSGCALCFFQPHFGDPASAGKSPLK